MIRKTSRAVNLIHATAKLLAGRNVLVCLTGPAARSTAGKMLNPHLYFVALSFIINPHPFVSCVVAQRAARTGLEVVIVPKASVGAVNVLALLQIGNVILMFVGIAGSCKCSGEC